jgi:hypothetical protein
MKIQVRLSNELRNDREAYLKEAKWLSSLDEGVLSDELSSMIRKQLGAVDELLKADASLRRFADLDPTTGMKQ